MKRSLQMLIVSGMMCFLALAARPARALDLVKDGKPCSTIVVAGDATQYQKWGAQWLQEYVEKVTGAKLEIVSETNILGSGALISVGHTALAKKAGLTTDDLKYDGCKLQVKDKVLYLIGRDYVPPKDAKPDASPDVHCKRPQGTVRAVTTFLEDVAGVRWLLPGPEGTFIPNTKDLSVADTLNKKFVPCLAYCETGYDTPLAGFANNGRYSVKFLLLGGDGTWEAAVPIKKYFKEHPEYFYMDAAGRRNGNGTQAMLCTSNRDVWKLILEWMRMKFDEGNDGVELGQSDGWSPCLCPACKKEFGEKDLAERIWVMDKWIIDELAKSHPGNYVIRTIYGPTYTPPKKFDCLPDNVIAEFCGASPDDPKWKGKFKASTVVDYYITNEGCVPTGFVPAFGPQWLQKRAKMWRDYGVMGAYGGGRMVCLGLGGPTLYVNARLAGDPDVNIDKLVADYCQGLYGESGKIMNRFFKLLHSRFNLTLDAGSVIRQDHGAEDIYSLLYPPTIVNQLDQLLKKAEAAAKTERTKGWLKFTRDSFDGLKTIANMFAAERAYELKPTRETLQEVKDRVGAVEEWRARIIAYSSDKTSIQRWFPGYYAMCPNLICEGDGKIWNYYHYHPQDVAKDLEKLVKGEKKVRGTGINPGPEGRSAIIEPITWDFEKMAANIGKAEEEQTAHAKRTTSKPGPDGALDPSAWVNLPGYGFGMYHAGKSKFDKEKETIVRLLYNDERLYVRFECGEPNIDNLKLKSLGHDGDVYYLDEVELFLNPECPDNKLMHLMAAPVKDAMYDERKGYKPDDPEAMEIAEWNADWTYTYTIDKEKKLWILEMAVPFKSLGVGTPKDGTVWTANFARARRAGGGAVAGEELSSWIPDAFGDPEIFGDLVFGETPGK